MTKPLKMVMREPCKECPFKVGSLPGWLGPHSPQQLFDFIHVQDGAFGCHMSIDEAAKRGENPKTSDNIEICTGSLLHAKKTIKSFKNRAMEFFKNAVAAWAKTPVMGFEFIEHHKRYEKPLLGQRRGRAQA